MGTLTVVSRRHKLSVGPVLVPIYRPTPLGNPFHVEHYGREECIARYRIWLWEQLKADTPQRRELAHIARLLVEHDVALVCWCKPLACHGDIVAAAVAWWQNQASA